ncbi:MAG: signal peptidase I [Clostridia bacterium]|nr:signal peptidase I [Clostridia bacterium]
MFLKLFKDKTEYSKRDFIFDIVLGFICLILIGFLFFVSNFWIATVSVSQQSMTNTINDGDVLILDKLATVERGDVIVFKQNDNDDYIKRVIGIEGDTIYTENGVIYVERFENGEYKKFKIKESYLKNPSAGTYIEYFLCNDIPKTVIGKGQYFVLGDNRESSQDSRTIYTEYGEENPDTTAPNYVGLVSESQIIGVVHQFWIENKDITTKLFG